MNQPIAATVTNAGAALRWLDRRPPDLEEVRQALARIVKDGNRATEVIDEIRALISEGARELLISARKAELDCVLVAVRDSGPGLAPATLERLFESFYTTKPGGLGLGLSICRSIIEAHGGRLWACANVARGAVFQFTVPAYPVLGRD